MKCPKLIIKTARLNIEDIEEYLHQNLTGNKEKEIQKMIRGKVDDSFRLTHPIITLGIGQNSAKNTAIKNISDHMIDKHPGIKKKFRERSLEEKLLIKAISKIIREEKKGDRATQLAVGVIKAIA